jgi:uncharacterized protein YegP (UPF0339 family)
MTEDPPKIVTVPGGIAATPPPLPPATVTESLPTPIDEIEPGHPGYVDLWVDEAGEWRFTVKGGNHEIVATSEGYTTKDSASRGYETLSNIMRHSKTEHRVVEQS